MKQVYVNSRLHSLPVGVPACLPAPREWIFSLGDRWLLLTPPRLGRIAALLGPEDGRIARILRDVRRWHPNPEDFLLTPGLEEAAQPGPAPFPVACPGCGRIHCPHPEDAEEPCPDCAGRGSPTRRALDAVLDARARALLLRRCPGDFEDGVLSPNWRLNRRRRLRRDWDGAVNRILLGDRYRPVARDYQCSVGLLHRKVTEAKHWEWN